MKNSLKIVCVIVSVMLFSSGISWATSVEDRTLRVNLSFSKEGQETVERMQKLSDRKFLERVKDVLIDLKDDLHDEHKSLMDKEEGKLGQPDQIAILLVTIGNLQLLKDLIDNFEKINKNPSKYQQELAKLEKLLDVLLVDSKSILRSWIKALGTQKFFNQARGDLMQFRDNLEKYYEDLVHKGFFAQGRKRRHSLSFVGDLLRDFDDINRAPHEHETELTNLEELLNTLSSDQEELQYLKWCSCQFPEKHLQKIRSWIKTLRDVGLYLEKVEETKKSHKTKETSM